ncbi:MAG: hypothetical protein A2341_00530 [Deltaproteobacteria bacterium RIFOXYB12_FULL_58_9]|nr:MAG: hypothetical protein A2341_00530 [Deltaproteobacteria bacterium RIFOXYB12_FULL_58_9]
MLRSLPAQVLWAPIIVLLVGCILVAVEFASQDASATRSHGVNQMRRQLDRVVDRVADRHTRTMRRTREALLEPRITNQTAILAWASEHYLREMEQLLAAVRQSAAEVAIPHGDSRLSTDLSHLDHQLDRIADAAQKVAPTLDRLLEAVMAQDSGVPLDIEPMDIEPIDTGTENPEVADTLEPDETNETNEKLDPATRVSGLPAHLNPLLQAQRNLDRADKEMGTQIRVAERMLERAVDAQATFAAEPIRLMPGMIWLLYLGFAVASLWFAARPALRISHIARGEEATASRQSDDERLLTFRLKDLADEAERLDSGLAERAREAERAVQGTRRAEHELALLKLYNENLMGSLRSAIIVTDASSNVTGFNRAARKLFDLDPSSIGTAIDAHPLFGALARRTSNANLELERAMSERDMLRFDGVRYPARQGEVLLDLTIAPYLDEGGRARGLSWVADDVTDAVRIKKQLLAAERLAAIGSLSAQVAHEIRNPLSAIGLNAELLEEEIGNGLDHKGQLEAQSLLRAIASEVERLTQITEGYLKLARLPQPEPTDVDLNQVVSDLLSMLEEELKAHGVTVDLDLTTPAPHAWADPGQLRQALLNIVRNSREAMPSGGTLRVSTRAHKGKSSIALGDTGTGIDPDVVHRVFEPFFTTKREGTGLGLSLTQQILAEHHGEVDIASTPPDGTTIRLTLPSRNELAADEDDEQHETAEQSTRKR